MIAAAMATGPASLVNSAETAMGEERRWKKPNEVVRMRKKLSRKSSLRRDSQSHRENTQPCARVSGSKATVTKRNLESDTTIHTPPKKSRSLLDISNSPHKTQSNCTKPPAPIPTSLTLPIPTSPPPATCDVIPLDWSLKTKVRFVSPFPFSWTLSLKPQQEAVGIMQFVKNREESPDSDSQTKLQQNLMVWTHPSLPFLKTFPRAESRQMTTQTPPLLLDEQILRSLKDDWSITLCSVYQLLKTGHCPYFYLCANHFTALFLSSGVCGCPATSAMLTPTTSGMREALKREGAELTLPLACTRGSDTGEECSDTEDDSAASTWLTSMGLPVRDFPALDPQKIALQRSREVNIDNRPESVVRVEGASVHALFNFLLTSKTTVTTTGSHAGIPPTILAPVAFKGSTLKALKVKQGSAQELGNDEMVRRYYLELSGPVLPQTIHNLCQLLQRTQHGQFTVGMTDVDCSGAFNADWAHREGTTTADPYLNQKPLGQKNGLKEIKCEDYNYTWK